MSEELKSNLSLIKRELPKLKEKYTVKKMGVFGSFAKNSNKEGSDIDVLVEFSKPIGIFDFINLEMELEKLLGLKVDLATPKALKPFMKKDVLKETVYV